MSNVKIWPGKPYPLGANFDGEGTHFSLFSEVAERVELCLLDQHGHQTRVDLPEVTAYCWHGYLPGIRPGQRYGFRVHGPWAPEHGSRCNSAKLLADRERGNAANLLVLSLNAHAGVHMDAPRTSSMSASASRRRRSRRPLPEARHPSEARRSGGVQPAAVFPRGLALGERRDSRF